MVAPRTLFCAELGLVDGEVVERVGVLVEDGAIVAVGPEERLDPTGAELVRFGDRALLPGTVNAHNHSFQSLLRGFGDDLPFIQWRHKSLYRYAPRLDADGVHVGALFAFGEMLLHGVTTVCDFFYLNDGGNENALAVGRAAERLGIRCVVARAFYDWTGAPAMFRERPADATARFLELHRGWRDARLLSALPAPHSLHGASAEMLRAGAACAEECGVPWHVHLAEEEYQVREARAAYGASPLRAIDKLGLLGPRLVAVHGCWFDEGERALMAERGARLAYNPSSNMFLGDGVTDVVDLRARGVTVALGTDGGCSNSRVSVFDEMRACALLQKVSKLDGQAITAEACFEMGTRSGGEVLGLPVGRLAPGHRADLVAVDLGDPSLWPVQSLRKNVVYAMSARAVTDVVVEGERVVRDRALTRVALEEIRARVRELTGGWR